MYASEQSNVHSKNNLRYGISGIVITRQTQGLDSKKLTSHYRKDWNFDILENAHLPERKVSNLTWFFLFPFQPTITGWRRKKTDVIVWLQRWRPSAEEEEPRI